MPKPRQFLIGILAMCMWSFLFSQYTLAQNLPPIHGSQSAKEHLKLGIDFYLTNELDEAIQKFQEAQQHWPEYANAHWNLGVGLAKAGDLEGAVAAWTQAERLDPAAQPTRSNLSALVTYNYGIALLKKGHLSLAMTEWEQALRIQPDFAEAHYALGQAYQIQGNTPLSQRQLECAVFWAPDWAEAINQLAVAHYHNGEYEKALAHLNQAIQLKPDYARAFSNLGLVHLATGNLHEAEKAFTKAITLNNRLPQAHFNLGLLSVKKKNWVKSITHLSTAIRLKPQFPDAHGLLGSALSSTGDWSRAIQEWQIALSLNPYGSYAHEIHYNIGMAHRMTNANAKAVKSFQRAVLLNPYSAPAHFQLGVSFETLEDWTNASDHYLFAIRWKPNWALPYFKLGLVRYNQGLLDAAIESYHRAIALHPEYAEAQFQLGVTLRAANRPRESLTHIRLAADQGMGEAQAMLATMYANGSGTQRNLVQAMRWWFQAENGSIPEDGLGVARAHLSRLRVWAYSHKGSPDDIQQVLDGFKAIQTDIQKRVNRKNLLPHANSVGIVMAQSGQRDAAIPILLQEAFALNLEAHDYLEYLIRHEEVPNHRSRILHYFEQTASEGSLKSCQFMKTLLAQDSTITGELNQPVSRVCTP